MSWLLVALMLADPAVRVVETGPPGSDLDSPDIPEAIEVLPALFAEAESTVDIAQMYMLYYPPTSRGALLYRLYDAIAAAASRGVRVRVLLDSTVLEVNPGKTHTRMPAMLEELPGVEARACDLRPFSDYSDCMMHAKYLVVDGRVAFVGSHNWSYGAMADNRELSLEVRDAMLAGDLARVFETDWRAAGGDTAAVSPGPAREPGCGLVEVAPARLRFGRPDLLAALCELANSARRSLDIEVNSLSTRVDFGPDDRFLAVDSLLRQAAGRGARVRLLVDRWACDHEPGLFLGFDSLDGIEVRVADIRRAGPNPDAGTAHGKLVIADGREALVGTATLSQRQLVECRNVGVRVNDEETVRRLAGFFERGWNSSWTVPVSVRRQEE
ncbi:hypothetical protein JXB37_05995 [candidate division WOR-3 bacterium]|nr:hypothetical protein [candidate division WOR-3 bacterium]